MAPPSLLGPPELYHAASPVSLQPTESAPVSLQPTESAPVSLQPTESTPSGVPFVDAMLANFNNINNHSDDNLPPMGFTENMSATFLSTGNPCLDFFFHVVPDTPANSLIDRLSLAWNHNPLMTLKLICNLRGVRGTGKSDKEGYYTAALWLYNFHPKTLAGNIPSIADFGYFKDLPEILYRLLEGSDVRKNQKKEWGERKGKSRKRLSSPRRGGLSVRYGSFKQEKPKTRKKEIQSSIDREANISKAMEKSRIEKEKASAERKLRKVSMARKVMERFQSDPNFQLLHDRISDFFTDCLKSDLQFMNSGDFTRISLAAKWCPSVDSSFDRSTLLCESIARKVFPRESDPEYEGIEEAHYAYRVRDRLRKDVLVPLRKVLELPEVYIGANRWDSIPYNRVASVAMKNYKEKFMKHDGERFAQYLKDVKDGKTKIAAGALLPHEIIMSLFDGQEDGGEVAVLQWKRMVDDLLKKGKLRDCIAVCDVSGSMEGIPMDVCIALGLLVSELSEDPWKGKVITFSANPELHVIQGDSLKSKAEFVKTMHWGVNTDFQKVFDQILKVAVDGKLKEEQMIKRVFVFSDMEFDQASATSWETDYQVIVRKFTEKGYGSAVPQIVFWNLRDSRATPVPGKEKGVALVSGYSKNLMNLFLDGDGVIQPEAVMEQAISGNEYQKLVVLD
ncbi:GPI inositol-deacylase PGAP1-like protein [Cucumis melo var. makuwa]|uniref:GPI inositol-deacylase PGAP1-like protein n=1 Tax=Cucumis melo var. makuwa TaxID=1194695 RepID=A0A5D3CYJ7_CUCMM|nr:GPI inositol-deacylase PGAP1-like protein [Cucumis melo var. makuwa]